MSSSEDRPHLHFCRVGERHVFLDVERDRYFGLPDPLDVAFRKLVEGDRCEAYEARALVAAGIASHDDRGALMCAARELTYDWPTSEVGRTSGAGTATLGSVSRALCTRLAWQHRTRSRALLENLQSLAQARARLNNTGAAPDVLPSVARAWRASEAIHSAQGRCLPNAMALMSALTRAGVVSRLVFAVRLAPFSAHCWIDQDRHLVCEEIENARSYTPILVW